MAEKKENFFKKERTQLANERHNKAKVNKTKKD